MARTMLFRHGRTACTWRGCNRKLFASLLCWTHYDRQRQGQPMDAPIREFGLPAWQRVLDKCVPGPGGCVVFTGRRERGGYGTVRNPGGSRLAHRIVFEHFVAPIPEDREIDHLCRNGSCVNPAHLEPVTQAENLDREWRARKASADVGG